MNLKDDITGERLLLLTAGARLAHMHSVPSALLPLTHSGGQAAWLKATVTIPVNRNQPRLPVGVLSSATNVIANVPYKLVSLSAVEDSVCSRIFQGSGNAKRLRGDGTGRGHVFIFWSVSMENSA